jgi:hypothetical protein
MKKKKICAEVYFLPSHCSDYWLGSELCLSFPITIPDIDCDDRRWRSEQTKTHIEQSVQLLKRTQINEKKKLQHKHTWIRVGGRLCAKVESDGESRGGVRRMAVLSDATKL